MKLCGRIEKGNKVMTRYKILFFVGLISGLICSMRPRPCIGYSILITLAVSVAIGIYNLLEEKMEEK